MLQCHCDNWIQNAALCFKGIVRLCATFKRILNVEGGTSVRLLWFIRAMIIPAGDKRVWDEGKRRSLFFDWLPSGVQPMVWACAYVRMQTGRCICLHAGGGECEARGGSLSGGIKALLQWWKGQL